MLAPAALLNVASLRLKNLDSTILLRLEAAVVALGEALSVPVLLLRTPRCSRPAVDADALPCVVLSIPPTLLALEMLLKSPSCSKLGCDVLAVHAWVLNMPTLLVEELLANSSSCSRLDCDAFAVP